MKEYIGTCTANMKRKMFAVTVCDRKTRKISFMNSEGKKLCLILTWQNYGYETPNFKRQVKNNIAKFEDDDFMFELDDEEVEKHSRCKNFTLNKGRGSNINTNCMCLQNREYLNMFRLLL